MNVPDSQEFVNDVKDPKIVKDENVQITVKKSDLTPAGQAEQKEKEQSAGKPEARTFAEQEAIDRKEAAEPKELPMPLSR